MKICDFSPCKSNPERAAQDMICSPCYILWRQKQRTLDFQKFPLYLIIHEQQQVATLLFTLMFWSQCYFTSKYTLLSSLMCSLRSESRKEEVAEEAKYEKGNYPVDRVDVDDHHVHVKAPAPRVALEIYSIQMVAASVGELASSSGTGRSLEACMCVRETNGAWHFNSITLDLNVWLLKKKFFITFFFLDKFSNLYIFIIFFNFAYFLNKRVIIFFVC